MDIYMMIIVLKSIKILHSCIQELKIEYRCDFARIFIIINHFRFQLHAMPKVQYIFYLYNHQNPENYDD